MRNAELCNGIENYEKKIMVLHRKKYYVTVKHKSHGQWIGFVKLKLDNYDNFLLK